MARVTVVSDPAAVAAAVAGRLTALIEQSIGERGNAIVCLTGGRAAKSVYERLANPDGPHRIDWARVHLFWGDERHVSPDDPDSNSGMAWRALLAHVPVPAAQIHRMPGESPDPAAAAGAYEATLREGFALAGRSDQRFDVMLLSVGEDAHIASIFPGSPLVSDLPLNNRGADLVRSAQARDGAWRIALTPAALLDARAILAMASGAAKADAVRAALELPDDIARWPAQLLRAAGDRVEWMVDHEAAAGSSLL